MSISELNHFMTYVLDGWILFSAGFVSIGFISFVSKRIQEDLEAEALALTQSENEAVIDTESVSETKAVSVTSAKSSSGAEKPSADEADPKTPSDEQSEEEVEAARLEEVAAVSEQLAKTKGKQTDTSSVSVST
ncbi:MAG: hypothetical protein ACFB0D_12890 [Phormidesmis sp.]